MYVLDFFQFLRHTIIPEVTIVVTPNLTQRSLLWENA